MGTATTVEPANPFALFPNASIYWLIDWHYGSSQIKSITDLDRLATDVIGAPNFDPKEVERFSAAAELK